MRWTAPAGARYAPRTARCPTSANGAKAPAGLAYEGDYREQHREELRDYQRDYMRERRPDPAFRDEGNRR